MTDTHKARETAAQLPTLRTMQVQVPWLCVHGVHQDNRCHRCDDEIKRDAARYRALRRAMQSDGCLPAPIPLMIEELDRVADALLTTENPTP